MDAGTIYRRLPGLTEGEAVALALAYHLGEADAHAERATGAVSGVVLTWDLPGAGRDAGRGRMHGLLGTLVLQRRILPIATKSRFCARS